MSNLLTFMETKPIYTFLICVNKAYMSTFLSLGQTKPFWPSRKVIYVSHFETLANHMKNTTMSIFLSSVKTQHVSIFFTLVHIKPISTLLTFVYSKIMFAYFYSHAKQTNSDWKPCILSQTVSPISLSKPRYLYSKSKILRPYQNILSFIYWFTDRKREYRFDFLGVTFF